jgi:hypothetical protein
MDSEEKQQRDTNGERRKAAKRDTMDSKEKPQKSSMNSEEKQ